LVTETFLKYNSSVPIPDVQSTNRVYPGAAILFSVTPPKFLSQVLGTNIPDNLDVDASDFNPSEGEDTDLQEAFQEEKEVSNNEEEQFWSQPSAAPKHFGNSIGDLLTTPAQMITRKRKCVSEECGPNKKAKQVSSLKEKKELLKGWVPETGDRVKVGYDLDCVCGKTLLDCVCSNVWFEGVVQSNFFVDKRSNVSGYDVQFDNGDFEHVEYELGAENDGWILVD